MFSYIAFEFYDYKKLISLDFPLFFSADVSSILVCLKGQKVQTRFFFSLPLI
jgi:hypothetical protein